MFKDQINYTEVRRKNLKTVAFKKNVKDMS